MELGIKLEGLHITASSYVQLQAPCHVICLKSLLSCYLKAIIFLTSLFLLQSCIESDCLNVYKHLLISDVKIFLASSNLYALMPILLSFWCLAIP